MCCIFCIGHFSLWATSEFFSLLNLLSCFINKRHFKSFLFEAGCNSWEDRGLSFCYLQGLFFIHTQDSWREPFLITFSIAFFHSILNFFNKNLYSTHKTTTAHLMSGLLHAGFPLQRNFAIRIANEISCSHHFALLSSSCYSVIWVSWGRIFAERQ